MSRRLLGIKEYQNHIENEKRRKISRRKMAKDSKKKNRGVR